MLGFSIRDAVTKRAVVCFKTSFGRMFGTSTYQKERSIWNNVNWAGAVSETALAAPDGDGSVEICDLIISGEKKSNGTITIHFDDGTNEKNVVRISVDDAAAYLSMNLTGKVQGWRAATLYYTVVGTFVGSITITYVKHDKEDSKSYAEMETENGW